MFIPQLGSFFTGGGFEPIGCGVNTLNSMGPIKVVGHMIPVHYLVTPRPPTFLNTWTQTVTVLLE